MLIRYALTRATRRPIWPQNMRQLLRQTGRQRLLPALCDASGVSAPIALFTRSMMQCGQPLHSTHPDEIKADELAPGISVREFSERRTRLVCQAPMAAANTAYVLFAAEIKFRDGSAFFPFHQDPNFYYLSGFKEPDAAIIIEPNLGKRSEHSFSMFVTPKTPSIEKWSGFRTGIEAAQTNFHADAVFDIAELPRHLHALLGKYDNIVTENVPEKYRSAIASDKTRYSVSDEVHRLRRVKSAAEIACMRLAGQYSGRVFNEAIRRNFWSELQLAAFFEYELIRQGCEKSAYVPVVAAGSNGICIHYTMNCDKVRPYDTIMIDGGGMYSSYVTDITRCWPESISFSPAQRAIYEAVLDAERQLVLQCTTDNGFSMADLHALSEFLLMQNLRNIGIYVQEHQIADLYPHNVGHRIGLEVHDCKTLRSSTEPLLENETICIEPGVYFDPADERWPKWARGLAVRIEDSVAVGKTSPTILSVDAVKEVADIESLRRQSVGKAMI